MPQSWTEFLQAQRDELVDVFASANIPGRQAGAWVRWWRHQVDRLETNLGWVAWTGWQAEASNWVGRVRPQLDSYATQQERKNEATLQDVMRVLGPIAQQLDAWRKATLAARETPLAFPQTWALTVQGQRIRPVGTGVFVEPAAPRPPAPAPAPSSGRPASKPRAGATKRPSPPSKPASAPGTTRPSSPSSATTRPSSPPVAPATPFVDQSDPMPPEETGPLVTAPAPLPAPRLPVPTPTPPTPRPPAATPLPVPVPGLVPRPVLPIGRGVSRSTWILFGIGLAILIRKW